MSVWRHTVSLKDFYESDTISLEKKGKLVAEKLKPLLSNFAETDDLEIMIEDFEEINEDDTQEFDQKMEALYDWADNNYVWIETF